MFEENEDESLTNVYLTFLMFFSLCAAVIAIEFGMLSLDLWKELNAKGEELTKEIFSFFNILVTICYIFAGASALFFCGWTKRGMRNLKSYKAHGVVFGLTAGLFAGMIWRLMMWATGFASYSLLVALSVGLSIQIVRSVRKEFKEE